MKYLEYLKTQQALYIRGKRISMKNSLVWWYAGLAVIALIVTAPAINGDLLNYDDERYISQNPWLSTSSEKTNESLWTAYFDGHYHPLTLFSLTISDSIGGDPIKSHHVMNWLLHAANAMVLFWLLSLLLKSRPLGFAIALIWAIHPVAVESYAWMTERKNVLYALFFLLSLCQYTLYLRSNDKKRLIYTAVFFLLSCLSKGQGILLLPLYFLIDQLETGKWLIKDKRIEKVGFLVIALVFTYLAREAQNEAWNLGDNPYSLGERFILGSYAFVSYIFHILAPFDLIPYYPYPIEIDQEIGARHYASLAGVAAYMGLLAFTFIKRWKWWFFGLAWFAINIVLLLKILEVPYGNYVMADRYAYLPMIGLLLPIVKGIWEFAVEKIDGKNGKWVVVGSIAVVLAFFTRGDIEHWSSSTELWGKVTDEHPNYLNGWNMYGLGSIAEGKPQQAIEAFQSMLEMDEESAEAPVNLAMLYEQMNRPEESNRYMQMAIERQPDELAVLEKAAILAIRRNKMERALQLTAKGYQLYPDESSIAVLRAQALARTGEIEEAILIAGRFPSDPSAVQLKRQIEQIRDQPQPDPQEEQARDYMSQAITNAQNGNEQEALRLFELAAETAPDFYAVYSNRASYFAQKGAYQKAEADFLKAFELAPNNGTVASMLGTLYKDMGDQQKACIYWLKASELGENIPPQVLASCR